MHKLHGWLFFGRGNPNSASPVSRPVDSARVRCHRACSLTNSAEAAYPFPCPSHAVWLLLPLPRQGAVRKVQRPRAAAVHEVLPFAVRPAQCQALSRCSGHMPDLVSLPACMLIMLGLGTPSTLIDCVQRGSCARPAPPFNRSPKGTSSGPCKKTCSRQGKYMTADGECKGAVQSERARPQAAGGQGSPLWLAGWGQGGVVSQSPRIASAPSPTPPRLQPAPTSSASGAPTAVASAWSAWSRNTGMASSLTSLCTWIPRAPAAGGWARGLVSAHLLSIFQPSGVAPACAHGLILLYCSRGCFAAAYDIPSLSCMCRCRCRQHPWRSGCRACSSDGTCSKCDAGYALKDGTCVPW